MSTYFQNDLMNGLCSGGTVLQINRDCELFEVEFGRGEGRKEFGAPRSHLFHEVCTHAASNKFEHHIAAGFNE